MIVYRAKDIARVPLTNNDRWFLIQLYRWFPSILQILQILTIIRPESSCVGIGPAFAATGVGNRAHWEGDRRLKLSCAR